MSSSRQRCRCVRFGTKVERSSKTVTKLPLAPAGDNDGGSLEVG